MQATEAAPPPYDVTLHHVGGQGLVVRGNSDQLNRVVVNLITNAYRYARTSVWLRVHTCAGDVIVAVEDDGDGVPEDLVGQLFEPFCEGGTADRVAPGLGLAIARRIVDHLGGSVTYGPAGGKGAGSSYAFPYRREAHRSGRRGRTRPTRGDPYDAAPLGLRRLRSRKRRGRPREVRRASSRRPGARYPPARDRRPRGALAPPLATSAGDVAVVLCSAQPSAGATDALRGDRRASFVAKPFHPDRLIAALDRMLRPAETGEHA